MANAKLCDRCDNFYKSNEFDDFGKENKREAFSKVGLFKYNDSSYGNYIDLCPTCQSELREFLNRFKEEGENDESK